MSSLLNSTDIAECTGILGDHFDTFKRTITVHKEPKKVLNIGSSRPPAYAGYGHSANRGDFTYETRNQSFQAIIVTQGKNSLNSPELQANFPQDGIKIKVEQAAKDYILDGTKTEYIIVNGETYNTIEYDTVQNYLGLQYYYFNLRKTN